MRSPSNRPQGANAQRKRHSTRGTPWVVIDATRGGAFTCQHCWESYEMALPVAIDIWVAAGEVFRKKHRHCQDIGRPDPRPKLAVAPLIGSRSEQVREWRASRDTGLSSETMLSAALGDPRPHSNHGTTDYPHDPADLGRCIRLIARIPWVVDGFPALRKASRVWAAYIDRWDEMLALYAEEFPTGMAPKLYDLMQAIREPAERGAAP
jgi:hypothetical protein